MSLSLHDITFLGISTNKIVGVDTRQDKFIEYHNVYCHDNKLFCVILRGVLVVVCFNSIIVFNSGLLLAQMMMMIFEGDYRFNYRSD